MSFLTGRLAALSFVSTLSLALAAGCSSASSADSEPLADPDAVAADDGAFEQEIRSKTDAQVKADIEASAVGANYTSESDYGFKFVSAGLNGQTSMTQALVREKLASFVDSDPDTDKPLASLFASTSSFAEWKKSYVPGACHEDEAPDPGDCAKIHAMNQVLEKNLRGIKVFYFGRDGSRGHVDGVAVSVIIVGRTPSGNLAGVRTIAIWT
jgi:hypothetical protein